MAIIALPTNHHDEDVKCIYLDQAGYVKYYMEYWADRIEVTKEKAEKSWRRMYKHKIDGNEYVQFVDHAGWNLKRECDTARKYGFEVIERMEWFD